MVHQECWSANGEDFNHQSLGELLDANDELEIGSIVYKGTAKHPTASQLCSGDDIVERIQESGYDIAGEYAEDYATNVTDEQVAELTKMVGEWINKYCPPNFYIVTDVTEYVLTEQDF